MELKNILERLEPKVIVDLIAKSQEQESKLNAIRAICNQSYGTMSFGDRYVAISAIVRS